MPISQAPRSPRSSKIEKLFVPFGRNPNFVGRESQLRSLITKFHTEDTAENSQRVALVGLGGIGKTQLALEFAFRIQELSPDCSVFWVPAIDAASFEEAYRKIGQELQIAGINDDKTDVKGLVKARLSQESAGKWIMIVDNADDFEMLSNRAGKGSSSPALLEYLPLSPKGGYSVHDSGSQGCNPIRASENVFNCAEIGLCRKIGSTQILDFKQLSEKKNKALIIAHL